MDTTVDILDTVLLNLRISEFSGKFLADLGNEVVEVKNLRRDGDGNVWVTYWQEGEEITVQKYQARSYKDTIKRVW